MRIFLCDTVIYAKFLKVALINFFCLENNFHCAEFEMNYWVMRLASRSEMENY